MPADTCRGLFAALAEGLGAVHGHGVTHRDLKPQNVILAAQGPQLIDFGIARATGQAALTETGYAPGTPGYTAPEVLLRNEVGPAADVFALGATVAYAATGRPPFGAGAPAGVSYRAVHEPVDVDGVDPGLAALIEACVAKDPAARPALAEIIARCGVRAALVEDPFYAALTRPSDAVPVPPGPAGDVPPVPAAPPVGRHELPTVGAYGPGDGYRPTYVPTQVSAPGAPARRRRAAVWVTASAAVAAVAVGTAFVLASRGGGDGGKEAGGAGATGTGASPSASASASGGAPAYAADKLDRTFWLSELGRCQLPTEERPVPRFLTSLADPEAPDVHDPAMLNPRNKLTIGFSQQLTDSREPYYVTVSVKPPHDIDPGTGRPAAGVVSENRNIGYLSKPVDLRGGGGPQEWKYLTYPDDFQQWINGERQPAIPLRNDPGDWTVQFHHIRTPDDYTSVECRGFTVK